MANNKAPSSMARLVDFSYSVSPRATPGSDPVCALNLTLAEPGGSQENPAQDHIRQQRVVLTGVALNDTVAGLARIRQQLFPERSKVKTIDIKDITLISRLIV